jgi:NitT/TauT family transport system substrate-binding protein
MSGTRLLTLSDSAKIISGKTATFGSIAGSSKIADEFNVKNGVYKESQDVSTYVDASLTTDAIAAKK